MRIDYRYIYAAYFNQENLHTTRRHAMQLLPQLQLHYQSNHMKKITIQSDPFYTYFAYLHELQKFRDSLQEVRNHARKFSWCNQDCIHRKYLLKRTLFLKNLLYHWHGTPIYKTQFICDCEFLCHQDRSMSISTSSLVIPMIFNVQRQSSYDQCPGI